jgi:hypothetical protein
MTDIREYEWGVVGLGAVEQYSDWAPSLAAAKDCALAYAARHYGLPVEVNTRRIWVEDENGSILYYQDGRWVEG